LTNVGLNWIPALASKIDDLGSWLKSLLTTSSSVYPKIPFNSFYENYFIVEQISSYLASLDNLTVKSTTLTLRVGTLKAIPVNFPFNSLITSPTALAAPVDDGIIF